MKRTLMITNALKTFIKTLRASLANAKSLAIFAGLYALLLATLLGFIATREATVSQVVITLFFVVLIPAEFFILQAAIVDHARDTRFQWRRILTDSCKLGLVTIPVIVLGYALFYLLNKLQLKFPAPPPVATWPVAPGPPKPQPLHWPTLLFATLRCFLFGIALPLLSIHLWIEVAAHDLRAFVAGGASAIVRRIGSVCARAFVTNSVLTYALGLIVFVAIPYALLFIKIPAKGTKTDFFVFIARLLLVFAFTLLGWIVTVGALATTEIEPTLAVSENKIEAEAAA